MLKDLNFQEGRTRSVLLYVRGNFHFPLIEALVRENTDIEFYLHSNLFGAGEVERRGLLAYANLHFVASLDELKYKLDQFGAFITTDAEPANPHAYSLRLIEFFHAIKVPVFELQHGLFQLGLHYYDVPHGTHFGGDSLPARTFADQVLTYYAPQGVDVPNAVIGYPPYDGHKIAAKGNDWTLVLSNLHWPTYTPDERRAFYESVYRLATGTEGGAVVWKVHHGEIGSQGCLALRRELEASYPEAVKRIRFCHEDAELSKLRLPELISRAKVVVSTVSTVLLDCEMHQKRVALYTCPSIACMVDRVEKKDVFSTSDELSALLKTKPRVLVTGHLLPYDNSVFRKAMDAAYRVTDLSREDYLSSVFALLQPLNSELRWQLASLRKDIGTESAKAWRSSIELAGEMRGRFEALQTELAGSCQTVREECTLAVTRAVAAESRAAQLGETLEAVRAEVVEGQGVIADLRTERESLLESVASEKTRAAQLGETLEAVRAEVVEGQGVIADLRAERETLLASVASEKTRAAQLGETLEAVRAEVAEGQGVIADLRAERETLLASVATEKARGNAFEKRIAELINASSALKVELAKVTAERDKARVERADRAQRVECLKGELATTREQLSASQRQIQDQMLASGALDKKVKKIMAIVVEERDRRRPAQRVKRFIKGLIPYGIVCWWKRMAYGDIENRSAPNDLLSRKVVRALISVFPYGLVRIVKGISK